MPVYTVNTAHARLEPEQLQSGAECMSFDAWNCGACPSEAGPGENEDGRVLPLKYGSLTRR